MSARGAALTAIFLLSWGLTTHGKYSATGDEPHYLMVAQSLWADGDLDVGNNYLQRDGALFGAAGLQPELHARAGRAGRILPVHDVGVPFVLLPVYVVATKLATIPSEAVLKRFRMNRGLFAYSLISLVMIALVMCAGALTIDALRHAGVTERHAAAIVLVAWLAPPILSNSFLVFPEPFALLVTAWALLEWTAPPGPWRVRDSAFVLALGLLPWMHRKYALYALVLFGIVLWRRRAGGLSRKTPLLALTVFVLPQLVLGLWTLHYWGNLTGPLALDGAPFSLSAFSHGAPGIWLDRENGLLWCAPVYALLPAAWWLRRSELGPWLLAVAALLIPAAAHDQWWGGFSPAGRFLVPLIPVFCLAGAALLERRSTRYAAFALLVPQLFISAYGWQHPRALWPQGDGENRILSGLLHSLARADQWLPSFRTAPDQAWGSAVVILLAVAALNVVVLRRVGQRAQAAPLLH